MHIDIPKGVRIFVIEGVAGSGKNTLHNELVGRLADKLVYDYREEELLNSWKHVWLPGIDDMRLVFMNNFLDHCSDVVQNDPRAVFLLNRFHLTCAVLGFTHPEEKPEYKMILDKLQKLKTHVYIATLEESEIEARSAHSERKDETWKMHLQKRMEYTDSKNLTELYSKQQKQLLALASQQPIPYSRMRVALPHP